MQDFQPKKKRPNQMDRVRGLTGMAMGVVYIFIGILFILAKQKQLFNLDISNGVSYAVGGLATLYGAFRIWRGWQIRKNA